MNKKQMGSCLCKNIAFEIIGEFESFFLCHCQYCQKDTGSAHAANLFSTKAELKWLKGQEKAKTYTLPQTKHVKSFCSDCGSALPNLQMDGKLLVVPAGSLDCEVTIRPNAHIFCANKASWEESLADIARMDGSPS